jgi:hypothetical protein
VSAGRTISFEKARADFGAVLRLADRFGSVKIMHGSCVVGVLTAGTGSPNTEPFPPVSLAHFYEDGSRAKEELSLLKSVARSVLSHRRKSAKPSKSAKKKPGK